VVQKSQKPLPGTSKPLPGIAILYVNIAIVVVVVDVGWWWWWRRWWWCTSIHSSAALPRLTCRVLRDRPRTGAEAFAVVCLDASASSHSIPEYLPPKVAVWTRREWRLVRLGVCGTTGEENQISNVRLFVNSFCTEPCARRRSS
jgi:hypothetical protein